MTIRFRCNRCNKVFGVKDGDAGKKGKCSCGAILDVPLKTISDKIGFSIESQTNFISESFLAVLIGSSALILAFSFICGAILTKPDKVSVAAQIEGIEQDIYRTKNESEQLKKQIVELKKANAPIVCDRFKLVTKVMDSTLDLSVTTDLPDDSVVMVNVSRSYWEEGSPDEYNANYLSERSTIEKWKSKHKISIAHETWEHALEAKQQNNNHLSHSFVRF